MLDEMLDLFAPALTIWKNKLLKSRKTEDIIKRHYIVPLKGLNEVCNLSDGIVLTYI